jgi:hypothetical protein
VTSLRQSFNSNSVNHRKLSSASSQFLSLASKSSYGDDSDLLDLDDDVLHAELIDCLKNAAVRILLTLMEFLEHGMLLTFVTDNDDHNVCFVHNFNVMSTISISIDKFRPSIHLSISLSIFTRLIYYTIYFSYFCIYTLISHPTVSMYSTAYLH